MGGAASHGDKGIAALNCAAVELQVADEERGCVNEPRQQPTELNAIIDYVVRAGHRGGIA
jgi:hypothetical protein